MVKLQVNVRGLIVGAVCGKNRLDANVQAMKYFPDCTSVSNYLGHPDLVWVSKNLALFNREYEWA